MGTNSIADTLLVPRNKDANEADTASVITELSVEQKIRELCRKVLRTCIAGGTLLNTLSWLLWEKNLKQSAYMYVYN